MLNEILEALHISHHDDTQTKFEIYDKRLEKWVSAEEFKKDVPLSNYTGYFKNNENFYIN